MKKTEFLIQKMDCPSEERLIRMSLEGHPGIKGMNFDIPNRKLFVVHEGSEDQILSKLEPLNFNTKIVSSTVAASALPPEFLEVDPKSEAAVLKKLLAINFAMFIGETALGIYAQSTGLIADGFDMAADAIVYGISLYSVGRAAIIQERAARLSGWFQLILAFVVYSEVIRRFFFGSEPKALYMMGVSVIALIANVSCLLLLSKHREGAVHMKASWIFSTNDVIANIGVIIAGLLVHFMGSNWPDLVIGTLVATVVINGARSILKMTKPAAN